MDPDEIYASYSNLGVTYFNQGNLEKAKQIFKKSIEFNPNNPDAYPNLGYTFFKQGDLNKARELHEKAIKINPNNVKGIANLGDTYYTDDLNKAIFYYKKQQS